LNSSLLEQAPNSSAKGAVGHQRHITKSFVIDGGKN